MTITRNQQMANRAFHGLSNPQSTSEKLLDAVKPGVRGGFSESSVSDLIGTPEHVIRRKKASLGARSFATSNIQFPSDLSAHAMVFQFVQSSWMKNNIRSRAKRIVHQVSLPVPANLVDALNVQYNEMELGAIGGALSDIQSLQQMGETAIGVGKEAYRMGEMVAQGRINDAKNQQGLATLALTNSIRKMGASAGFEGATRAGLARFFGNVPNPTITALFKGVGLRSHNFSWRLSPQNIQESYTLHNIINRFKAASLPARTNQNLTLEFPDEIHIYIRGHIQDLHMYQFKKAVIKSVSTNYAPDNLPNFFAGTGAPTHVDFKLDLLETSIHTREDYPEYDVYNPTPGGFGKNVLNRGTSREAARSHGLEGWDKSNVYGPQRMED